MVKLAGIVLLALLGVQVVLAQTTPGPNAFNTNPDLCKGRRSGGAFTPTKATGTRGAMGQTKIDRFAAQSTPGFLVVDNTVLRVGVVDGGQLNAYPTGFTSADVSDMRYPNPVGLRYHINTPLENDATSPGCLCEGFGASAIWTDTTYQEGAGNQASGEYDENYVAPVLVGSNGVQTSTQIGVAPYLLTVQHVFQPSGLSPNFYQVTITLTNSGPLPITQLQYVRSMDWDIYPSTFWCCVDVDLGNSKDVICAHDNGFIDSLPSGNFEYGFTSGGEVPLANGAVAGDSCFGAGTGRSFFNTGPVDHGAAFLIQFHDITAANPMPVGGTKTFNMFYGAAPDRATATTLLGVIGAEAYSFGYPSDPNIADFPGDAYYTNGVCNPANTGAPNTYIWAFAGVSGAPIFNSTCGANCEQFNLASSCTGASATTDGTCVTLNFGDGATACGTQ